MSERKYISRIGWIYTIYIFVTIGAQLVIGSVIALFQDRLPMWVYDGNMLMLLSQLVMYGIAFPVFALLMRSLPPCRMAKPKRIRAKQFLILLVVCFGAVYIGNLVGSGLMKFVEIMTGTKNINPVDDLLGGMNLAVIGLTTVVIAPVMEELMFRKYLVDRLVPYGQKTAVVMSGLAFALFHGNFYQFFYAALLGMIFAYIYSSTGKIRYTITLHMIINFVGGVLVLLLSRGADRGMRIAYVLSSVLGLFCLASIGAAVGLVCLYFKRLPWFRGWVRPERGLVLTVLCAPGVWAFLAASVCLFLLG